MNDRLQKNMFFSLVRIAIEYRVELEKRNYIMTKLEFRRCVTETFFSMPTSQGKRFIQRS